MAIYIRPFALNVLTLTLFPFSALADQNWSVTDGTTVEVTEGYHSTDTTIPLYAAGANSQLITDSNLSFSTTADSTYVAHIREQAGLTLNDATLSSEGISAYGVYLYQNSSLIMNGGSVSTSGYGSNAIQSNNSSLSLTDADISTSGASAYVLYMSGGTLNAENVQMTASGTSSSALYLSGTSGAASATLNNVEIDQTSINGGNAIAVYNSSLTATQLTVDSSATSMPAILGGTGSTLALTDSSVTAAYTGIRLMGGSATLTNVDVSTNGSYGYALDVNVSSSATIQGGSYQTTGIAAHGVWLSYATSSLEASDTRFVTSGTSSHAVDIQSGSAVITDSTLSTSGNYSYGYYTESQAEGSGLTISTTGTYSYGAVARGGNLVLSDSTVTTTGNGGYGLVAMTAGTLTATDSVISTSGANAAAILSSGENSVITAENITATTSGRASSGAQALNGGTITLLNSTLTTTGDQSTGLSAQQASTITADGVTVSTAGADAAALQTSLSTLNISNSQLTTTGLAVGLLASGQADGQQNTVTLDNVTLTSEQSTGVLVQGSDLELTLQNGTVITGGDGVALQASATEASDGTQTHSTVTVNASGNVSLLGDVIADSEEEVISLSLSDNSLLSGVTQSVSLLSLDSTSRWVMSGDSTVVDLQQDGLVTFNSASGFSTLTVTGDLSGSGEFVLRTEAGDDDSPTDQILVNGNATGDFSLTVVNQNGLGALTNAGILLVKVAGDATSASFTQKGSVVAGLYEYFVNKVGDNSWYLQSSYIAVDPDTSDTTDDTAAGENVVSWRPEIAGYMMAPYLNAAYGFQSAGNYHTRLGAYQQGSAVWGRTWGRHDRYAAGRYAYNVNSAFVQLGGDVMQKDLANGWHSKAGPMLTLGRIRSGNRDNARTLREGLSAYVGKTETTAYGVGGYFTAWHDDGSYLDTVGQITRYSNRFTSLTRAKMDSYSALLSAEVGKPFSVYQQLSIEPQFQLIGQYMNISQGYASGVKMKDQNITTGQARLGARLFYDATRVQPYVKADIVRQLGKTPGMILDDQTFRPDISKGYWQTGLGIAGKVSGQLSLYAEASYVRSMGKGLEGYNGNLGIKYHF
ncbi:autotransporter outer membrane beta-barrel domain-containing protein [Erwinia papayae]|uniref:Autotransporter outer membrane beta-barrel domain-containing protein n=1 Tax=Erwinia papayae TaxID=206499 RepID=A0ABV3N5M8_9GAMM